MVDDLVAPMDLDRFWAIVEQARASCGDRADDRDDADDPLTPAVIGLVAALEPDDIIAYAHAFIHLRDVAYVNRLWGAAYLIEGGCGDDGFMDFRAGLILLGRERFTRAVADPETLAELEVVARMSRGEGGWIGCEEMNYAAWSAYEQVVGNTERLDASFEGKEVDEPKGESWDHGDEEETRRRLPRLASMFQ